MQIINSPVEMQQAALALRRQGRTIGLVPTMGFLHAGHLSLVEIARRESDAVVLSIFVNPRQFGPHEDLAKYPRDLERDSALCRRNGVDYIFNPPPGAMYPGYAPDRSESRSSAAASPAGYGVFLDENDISKRLCGASRPGHFSGVLTVVAKLFNIVLPDAAVFGQKDAQQAALIERMVADLNCPVKIIRAPIVREKDGLAMSSRNVYLSAAERADALCLSRALKLARRLYRAGERDCGAIMRAMAALVGKVESARIDYIEIVGAHDFKPVRDAGPGAIVAMLAVRIGNTRLIDNLPLPDDRLSNLPEE